MRKTKIVLIFGQGQRQGHGKGSFMIVHIIDKELSQKESALILRLGEGELDGFQLKSFKEKQLLKIPYTQSFKKIQEINSTGKLLFEQRLLVVDLYGKVEFHFLVEPAENDQLLVSGQLQLKDKKIALHECNFVCPGPPHWFIQGISLKIIKEEVPWSSLKPILSKPCIMSVNEVRELLYEDDEPLGPITFAGNSKERLQQGADPTPVLMLKERTGAFADLWMDYGNNKRFAFHDMTPSLFKRQKPSENAWEKDLLETDFIRKITSTSHYYCPMDKVAKSLGFLLELGWQVLDWKGHKVVQQKSTELSMQSEQQSVIIKGKIHYDNFEADLTNVLGAFNRRERFVQLGSGVVGLLPQKWEQTGLNGIEEGEIIGDQIKLQRNQIGSLTTLWESEIPIEMDHNVSEMRERLKTFNKIETALPGSRFKGDLRPYQQVGVNWLAFLYEFGFHGILADDMGLGKTVQVLAFLSQLKNLGKILIVLPTSLIFNWKREIEKFFPDCAVYTHQGSERHPSDWPKEGIILTSYTTLRIDLLDFQKVHFECIIIDEAQAIKNSHTQISQAVCSLHSRFRLSITGTPIENHLNELWSHFRFLMPDLLGSEKEFESAVQASSVDPRHLQKIKKKVRPFLLRRTKNIVTLPERIDQTVWVEMDESQRRIYEDFLAGVRGNLFKKVQVDGLSKHRMEVLEAILRLRQICCHPLLVSAKLDETSELKSAKMEALLEDLETVLAEGSKAIVYSQFTSMLRLIGKALQERGWNFVTLEGTTVDREKVVTQFQQDETIPLFLISLKAGGVGLNLTAADYVFLYDPWWNEAVEEQAINRAHRIGRDETVIAKRFVTVETIEEKIMKLKSMKRVLVDSILDGDMESVQLTDQDFLYLLSL
jgi:superfamily II DNA or RNA helicase